MNYVGKVASNNRHRIVITRVQYAGETPVLFIGKKLNRDGSAGHFEATVRAQGAVVSDFIMAID